jgi:hypothetical protein
MVWGAMVGKTVREKNKGKREWGRGSDPRGGRPLRGELSLAETRFRGEVGIAR